MEQKTCKCGCGQIVKRNWVRGHHSRVNNISKREDIKQLRRQKMQEWHNSGNWTPWNKGVSNERTIANGKAISISRGNEFNQRQSVNMSNSWKKGKIIPLVGPQSPNWKGGTSSLVQMLRSDWSLYTFWKRPILERDGFKCSKCSDNKELSVHHDQIHMCDIIHLFIPEDKHELSYEEKKKIICDIVEYHVENKVSGITLCKRCHKDLHNSYNL